MLCCVVLCAVDVRNIVLVLAENEVVVGDSTTSFGFVIWWRSADTDELTQVRLSVTTQFEQMTCEYFEPVCV